MSIKNALDALQIKDYLQAVAEFTSLLVNAEDEKKPFLLWSRLGCYVELNDNDCINRDCLAILDLPNLPTEQELLPGVFSTHSGAAARLVTLNEKLGFSAKAAAYARMFSDLQSYSVNAEKALAIKNEGNELFARDQVLDAVEKYRDALRYNPKDFTIHSNLSRCFLLSGDKESAKDHAEKCIKYAPEWSKGWYRLGKVQVQMEAYFDAVKSFEIALDLEPGRLELKRELAEAQYLADKLGNCDPGFDARTQGILYSMSQTSWDILAWYKENSPNIKYMTFDELEQLFSPHLNSFDFLVDVHNIMQSKFPQYKKWMTPIEMDSKTKGKMDDLLSSRPIVGFLLASDPLLTAAIFFTLQKRLFPKTLCSVAFTFDIDSEFFGKSKDLYPFIREHGKYACLVSTEADGLIIDFMAMWESILTGKDINKRWFDGMVTEKAFQKDGFIYTVEDKDEFIECLEGVYKRDRLKASLSETLKTSVISVKKSSTSDSVHTLTEDVSKLHSDFAEPKVGESETITQNNIEIIREFETFVEDHNQNPSKESDNLASKNKKLLVLISVIFGAFAIYCAVNWKNKFLLNI